MLSLLLDICKNTLPTLLLDPTMWNTLDINYEPPHVERLWLQVDGDHRLYVHLIHPCEKALFHPHPWPSAVVILDRQYEMEVGYGSSATPPPVASKVVLAAGSSYEMLSPDAWHSVRPLGHPTLSVMLTGRPFASPNPASHVGKDVNHGQLTDVAKHSLIQRAQWALSGLGSI